MQKITLTVKEVAELLDVSLTTVYSMTRMNEIPYARIRGKILFHRPTIEAWLMNGAMQNYGKLEM
ncbi:helix-turn-helix domain-containing protein [Bacillus tropicus]|uniref:helix-turn-helix domain-containing protein n=1 Tax=Bacillus tropicus TaxID=2026188 RepID=UPI000BE49437|nr:excisionase [Bacillus cereus]